jgi:single-stranded-DNA-specific exonuclease
MIVTVDNGITALQEAELIAELGMRLVVTDHHQPLETLPRAEAVVDPHRQDSAAPFQKYCGAGIALLLIAAMDGGDATMAMEQFGELAAIATVADVVELSGENRLLVQQGLRLLANTERPGLLSLMEKSGVMGKKLTATTVAFSIAPRINAAGRFGSPLQAVHLLLAETAEEADALAEELEHCNQARKKAEEAILEEIQQQIAENPSLLCQRVLVFAGAHWHHGVIGIVAARLQEKFGKPTFVITLEEQGARGSARAFASFSVFACLDACRQYLTKYGGHMGAGGFSLEKEQIPAFTAAVQQYAMEQFPQMPVMTERADKLLLPQDLTTENIAGLEVLEPYGAGNPTPVFALCHAVLKERVPLSGGVHTKLKLLYGSMAIECLLFRTAPEHVALQPEDLCDLLVTVGLNRFRGRTSLSMIVKDYRKSGVKQAKYFAAQDAYEQFSRGEPLSNAYYAAIAPSRDALAMVYRAIPEHGIEVETLFVQLQQAQMNLCKLRIALDVFTELGLVKQDFYHGTVCRLPVQGKVNLEDSALLRTVREKGEV